MKKIHYPGRICMGAMFAAAMLYSSSPVSAQLMQAEPSYIESPFTFMTFDKNVKGRLYAFSYGYGQAYVSSDNGEKWKLAIDFNDYYAGTGIVNSIRDFKPGKNPDIVYFQVKLNAPEGEGIFSVNHMTGEIRQYKVPETGYIDSWISSFDVFDEDGDVVIADVNFRIDMITIRSMVCLTKDGGETWTPIYRNWESEFIYPAKVAFCPDNQSKLYIFRGNGPSGVNGGILISEDEGKTWHETLPGHSLQTYAFNPLNPEEIYVGTASYAAHEAVFHSTDGGETWEIVDFSWTPFILNNVIDITYDRLDPNNVIVVEEDQIFMTSDGFRTFANIAPEGYMWGTIVSINPFDSDDVVIGVDMNGIMRSDDRMQTHRMISSFKVDSYCGDVATSGEDVFYLRSGLCRMLGSGASVEEKYASVYADVAGSHSVFAYDADADRLDRIVFSENPVRSTVCSGMGKPSGIVAAGSDGRYIAGMGGKLYTVEIGADDVSCTDTGIKDVVSLSCDDTDVYVATTDRILISADDCRNWDTLADISGCGAVRQISADGGMLAVLTDGALYSVDPKTSRLTLMCALEEKLLDMSVSGNTIAVLGTGSDGIASVRYSRDGGKTWELISGKELEYCHAGNMGVRPSDGGESDIYIASSDMGLLKYSTGADPVVTPDPVLPGDNEVRMLEAAIVSDGSCRLSWISPEGHYDATYNVYRDGSMIAENIKARELCDRPVSVGEHIWRVTTVYEDIEGGTAETDGVEATAVYTGLKSPVTDACVKPDNLVNGDAVAVVEWGRPDKYDICRYNVYRDGRLVAGDLQSMSYMDRDLDGGRHEWEVAAVYDGAESQHVSVCADVVNSCAPVRDLDAYFDLKDREIDLEWSEPGDLPVGWLSRCGEPSGAYGPLECVRYDMVAATRWTADELDELGLVGSSVTDITFVPMTERARYFARVWIGSENGQPADEYILGNLIGIDGKIGEWNIVSGNPIEIPEGKDLWIGVGVQYAGAESPIGMDGNGMAEGQNYIRDWFNKPFELLEDYDGNARGNFCLGARFTGRDGARMKLCNAGGASDVTYEITRDGDVVATTSDTYFSEGSLEEKNYVYGVRALYGKKGSSPSADIEVFAGNKCPRPSDINIDADGKSVNLSWKSSAPQFVQEIVMEENFDGTELPEEWTLADNDKDGYNWFVMHWDGDPNGFMMSELLVYSETGEVHNLSPDNWLISPKINLSGINGKLIYYVSALGMWMNQTYYEVLVSTTGTDPDDFTLLKGEVVPLESTIWLKKVVDLSAYSGEIYIAIRHRNESGDNCMGLYFDTFSVSHEVGKARCYNIYRDGMLIAGRYEGTSFSDEKCPGGDHEWTITAVCDEYECESDPLTVSATVSGSGVENVKDCEDAIYYDARHKTIIIYGNSDADDIKVYDVAGNLIEIVARHSGNKTVVFTEGYDSGVYIVKCGNTTARIMVD